MRPRFFCQLMFLVAICATAAWGTPPLETLTQSAPYAPDHTWPVLTAAQWTGDANVDAVILLSIDDMRDSAKYEAYLRPILDKLAAIGAPGALSIFTNSLHPDDPQLQAWIKEGLSIEAHTIKHPCPILCQGNLEEAKKTYDECVDLLATVPNQRPVASRVPCCDSMNSASPRYFSEIFNKTTPSGRFLEIDSSVFCVFTNEDPALPEELTQDAEDTINGRFGKYLPFPAYTTTIANYPYPYVIGNTGWEFPCIVPSDWEAQNRNTPNAPLTVEDMKAAIDATVLKQGTYTLCFHPHNWIQASQVVELIEHAHTAYGERVRFMSFATAAATLRSSLLQGNALRGTDGVETGVRLLDLNVDGYMDVVVPAAKLTRVWQPEKRAWKAHKTPFTGPGVFAQADGVVFLQGNAAWRFDEGWQKDATFLHGLDSLPGLIHAVDIDRDGNDELIASAMPGAVWVRNDGIFAACNFSLPAGTALLDENGRDAGLRFVDIDEDRDLDIVFSNEARYGVWIFDGMDRGWSTVAHSGVRGEQPPAGELPPIVVNGTDNGFWAAKRTLWWHNEHTDTLPDRVDRRAFAQVLAQVKPRAKTVAEAEATLRSPGHAVSAIAAEPLVRDPVCIAWDARGRLWTAEMRDYPLGLDGNGAPGSEIRVLDDTNRDGVYDKATVFLDGLAYATGVMPWRDGAIVTCAPEIFFAADRDGDGKAEYRETLFEGFGEGNQQHRINGMRWGGDGWIYAANGDSNGEIRCLKTGAVVDIRGRDLRFNPDTGELQTVTGNAQFGRVRDDFGRWFGCANWSPMWAYTLEEEYQERNPFLAAPDPRDFFVASDRVFPISVITERFNDFHMAGLFTSACGVEVYRDTRLGPSFAEGVNVFTCEPVHNLVFRARGAFDEGGFEGGRVDEERTREFLASTDPWFRPVMARTGPDGALYIADMYRQVIEHPEYINVEKQKEIDMRAGEDEGRIWRVAPGDLNAVAAPDLTAMGLDALVGQLAQQNGTLRELAQQRIYELNDAAAAPLLRTLASDKDAHGAARVAAMWSLRMAGALDAGTVAAGLTDAVAGVVLNALRLSEGFLLSDTAVQDAVLAAARRAADVPELRVQAAYTLGAWDDPRAWEALEPFFNGGDVLRVAAMSSLNERSIAALWPALAARLQAPAEEDFGAEQQEQMAGVIAGLLLKRDDKNALREYAAQVFTVEPDGAYPIWRWRAACALLDSIDRFGSSMEQAFASWPETLAKADAMTTRAREAVADGAVDDDMRALAARLLGRQETHRDDDAAALSKVIDARTAPSLIQTALSQLQRMGGASVAGRLIENWAAYSPALQGEVAEVLFSRAQWTEALVAALESGALSPRQLGAAQRQRLLTDDRPRFQDRIAKIFGATATSDRQPVIERFQDALALTGNREHGKAIFTERCAVCHQLDGVGHRVGADLAAITDRRPEALLISVLDPNRAVETRYLSYEVETADLSTFNGILSEESATGLTLTGANAQEKKVLRSEITAIRSTNRSIMPDGLEEGLTPQDIADLLSFVAGAEAPAKQLAGNAPKVIAPDADGVLLCAAETAEVRGTTLTFEARTRNLGFWGSMDDHATWRLRDVQPGAYRVEAEFCCDNTQAGNMYRLSVGANVLTGTVRGTGTWDNYTSGELGVVRLTGKETSLRFAPDSELKGFLIDLRGIRLIPEK